ncbi:hypothetical protein WR25_18864 [Diploscapter pachys]|uniref:CCR4-NOT transcription complex subunit 4 n=1 Tax=Diploscapter pachys TaxID=2018661 RepID=A0A2A2LUF6_9BILA|nr:hypothetical protein WR25_18864 [Diploscapter pachys]
MSCSSDDQSDKECPLCMETLEIDDINFYPCKCEYQICRFCWHRLRTDENGLCPACRQPYPELPANFKPLSTADVQRLKDEKRLKQQAEKIRLSECRQYLSNYRVLQKNLVYVVGLSPRVADYETLKKPEYFGRFGRIQKIVIGTANATALHILNSGGGTAVHGPSYTAYLTYSRVEEALRCIQAVNNAQLDGRNIKASLGTTKYCSAFMQNKKCFKPECMYLHEIADSEISFTKEDMHQGKHTEYEKRLIETVLSKTGTGSGPGGTGTKAMCNNSTAVNSMEDGKNSAGNWDKGESTDREDRAQSEETSGGRSSSGPPDEDARSTTSADSGVGSQEIATANNGPGGGGQQQQRMNRMTAFETNNKENQSEAHGQGQGNGNESGHIQTQAQESNGSSAGAAAQLNTDDFNQIRFASEDYGSGRVPAPAPVCEAPAPLTNWQTLLGLTPQPPAALPSQSITNNRSVPTSSSIQSSAAVPSSSDMTDYLSADDDLGFDPFSESSKGLAMLLEEEKSKQQNSSSSSNISSNWLPSMPSDSSSSLCDLWGRLPLFAASSNSTSTSSHHVQSPYEMYGLQSAHANPESSNHQLRSLYENGTGVAGLGYSSYANGAPPGFQCIQRPASIMQQHNSQGASISEWQQGFKALLPNVNIRFLSDLEHSHQNGPNMTSEASSSQPVDNKQLERNKNSANQSPYENLDEFEADLVFKDPQIVGEMLKIDRQILKSRVSKKQLARDRLSRLEKMTEKVGRTILEQKKPKGKTSGANNKK